MTLKVDKLDKKALDKFLSDSWRFKAHLYRLIECLVLRQVNSEKSVPLYGFRKQIAIVGTLLALLLLGLGDPFNFVFLGLVIVLVAFFFHNYFEIKKVEISQEKLDAEIRALRCVIDDLTGFVIYTNGFIVETTFLIRRFKEIYADTNSSWHSVLLSEWKPDWGDEESLPNRQKEIKSECEEVAKAYPDLVRSLEEVQRLLNQVIEIFRNRASLITEQGASQGIFLGYDDNVNLFGKYIWLKLRDFY